MKRMIAYGLLLCLLLTGCSQLPTTPTNVASTETPITESVVSSAQPEESTVSETQPVSQPEEGTASKEESKPVSKPASSKPEKEPAEESASVSPLPAELDYSPKEGVPREEKVFCTKTTEDDYVLGTIHVGIQLAYSKVNRVWTAQHFPELSGIVEIEDLTYVETQEAIERFEQKENFHQILSIRISDQSKEAVIDGIKALEKSNPYIYCADPNDYHSIPEWRDE